MKRLRFICSAFLFYFVSVTNACHWRRVVALKARHTCHGCQRSGIALYGWNGRKSSLHGTTLRRACCCAIISTGAHFRPYHWLAPFLARTAVGAKLFPEWSHLGEARLRQSLQRRLTQLGIVNPESFGLHSFRRGHAHQLLIDGRTLADVLKVCHGC